MRTQRELWPSRRGRSKTKLRNVADLTAVLLEIAALVAIPSACSSPGAYGSCDGFVAAPQKKLDVGADVACAVANQANVAPGSAARQNLYGPSCMMTCGAGYGGCVLADEYVAAYLAARSDAGAGTCPSISGSVELTCLPAICEGRLTDGIDRPAMQGAGSIGNYFAACCHLEAASVHAFARLREELAAHQAPSDLLDAAKRAERDEVRHVALTLELALRFGVEPERPAPPSGRARTLFDVACENAVEGCVRETYGAVVALVRAA